jgi:hypothetical protein
MPRRTRGDLPTVTCGSQDDNTERAESTSTRAVWAHTEKLHRMTYVGEPGVGGYLLGPPLDSLALDLDATAAVAAGEVMMVSVRAAAAVQDLAARAGDGVDLPGLAEHLEMAVDGGQADVLAAAAQLGMNLLSAAESGQPVQGRGQHLGLAGTTNPGAARGTRRNRGLRGTHTRTVAAS